MSMRILKPSNGIEVPNDDIVLTLELTRSGKMSLQAPSIHPSQVCKVLFGVVVDLMYSSFQMQDHSGIVPIPKSEILQ